MKKNWESIKTECMREAVSWLRNLGHDIVGDLACELIKELRGGFHKGSFNMRRRIEDEVVEAIMNTDIRNWPLLMKHFPGQIPGWIKAGKFNVELSDAGWEFYRTGECECCGQYT